MNGSRQLRRAARTRGFTLIEMMVALAIGALVVASVFSIGGASARHFQEQQRIGVTQRSVRMAMGRLQRDIQRAGYMHVPSNLAPEVNMCATPTSPRDVPAIWMTDSDTAGNRALDALNRTTNGVSADRLRLIGNYGTGDQFLVDSISSSGNVLFLQEGWLAFRRSFTVDSGGTTTSDPQRFADVFQSGRMLHIQTGYGQHAFVRVTAATIDALGQNATVSISPGMGVDNPCVAGLGRGTVITPLSEIEYSIQAVPAASTLSARSAAVVGPNTQLVREELDMSSGAVIPGTRRVVLEYAIDFNIDAFIDNRLAPTLPPNLVSVTGAAAQNAIRNTPWQVRSLVVSLAARTPEQDRRFPWTYSGGRPATAPLNRFLVFRGQPGAARVRQLITEVQTPNLVQ